MGSAVLWRIESRSGDGWGWARAVAPALYGRREDAERELLRLLRVILRVDGRDRSGAYRVASVREGAAL